MFDADHDADANGIPDDPRITHLSTVGASGTAILPAAATLFSEGARAQVGFDSSFNPATESFEGDYELVLGSLKQEPSIWRFNPLTLFFSDTDTPEQTGTFQNSQVRIENAKPGHVTTVPGETITVDMNYCFSQVNIGFRSLAARFINPSVAAYGTFDGTDFRGEPATYTASPALRAEHRRRAVGPGIGGRMPAPRHLRCSGVRPVSESCRRLQQHGVAFVQSGSRLPSIHQSHAGTPTQFEFTARMRGFFRTPGFRPCQQPGNVNRIYYTINGGLQIDLCVNCGVAPSFNFEATLASCENEVTVTAVDEFGDEASATGFVHFDATPPVLTGCENLSVKVSRDATEATVNFAAAATDNCDPAVVVTCVPPSGSFFPVGETTVTCAAADKCGNVGQCTFTVRVTANDPPVARCKDVTVFAGVNCSAAADINDGSIDPDLGDTITVSQSPAGPYPLGDTLVTLTVTDNQGASNQCTATVTVVDNTPPQFVCPPNVTVAFNALPAPVATDTDNCDPDPTVTSMDSEAVMGPHLVVAAAIQFKNRAAVWRDIAPDGFPLVAGTREDPKRRHVCGVPRQTHVRVQRTIGCTHPPHSSGGKLPSPFQPPLAL
ncbi:MAG: HYR domain-containing protein [Pedosphaera sp.]|nr:HYR domain-containing protein [Pedosphaera sp.]